MIVPIAPLLSVDNVAELIHQLGDIPPERILMKPLPGTATEEDLIALLDGQAKRVCELVDGVLVEKPMGTRESLIAGFLAHKIWSYLEKNDRGIVIPGDGPLRLRLGLVRIPDASFVPWSRIPGGELPDEPIASLIPTLAIEVKSTSNTEREIDRKLEEYFDVGVRLAWIIDPDTELARIHRDPIRFRPVAKQQMLMGQTVLPGFSVLLGDLLNAGHMNRRKRR